MMDGTVQLWRSDKLLTNNNNDAGGGDAVEIKMEDNSVVSALKFCPHKDNGGVLLARLVLYSSFDECDDASCICSTN